LSILAYHAMKGATYFSPIPWQFSEGQSAKSLLGAATVGW